MPDLEELDDLLTPSRGQPVAREDVETAIQALLFHQFLYEDSRGAGKSYDLIRRHRPFFDRYFSAMGMRLHIEQREAMVALLPQGRGYGWKQTRLTKDETMILLTLRYLLESGAMQGQLTETGRVETTTDELLDALRTVAAADPPSEGRLLDILKEFRRRGLVRLEERNTAEQVTPLLVMPGVRYVCTDEFARHVADWATAPEEEKASGDILDFITRRRAEAAAAEAAADVDASPEPDQSSDEEEI